MERLIQHYGEEKARQLLDLIGEDAYNCLPPRGTGLEEAQKKISALEEQVKALTEEKTKLEEALKKLEEEKAGVESQLKEAQLKNAVDVSEMVPKKEVIAKLREAVFERVPRFWGEGPYRLNEQVKRIIRELEEDG